MFKLLAVAILTYFSLFGLGNARIHHLKLIDDSREQITVSTYGFLKNGILQVDVKKLEFNQLIKLQSIRDSFAFILEKTSNNGFSSFTANAKKEDYCSIIHKQAYGSNNLDANKTSTSSFIKNSELNNGKRSYSLIIFHLDLVEKKAEIIRIGSDLHNLNIESKFNEKIGLAYRPDSKSNSSVNNLKKLILPVSDDNYESDSASDFINNRGQLKLIDLNLMNSSLSFRFQVNINSPNEEGLYILNFFNCLQPDQFKMTSSDLDLKSQSINPNRRDYKQLRDSNYYSFNNNLNEIRFGINLELDIFERNQDSFLSAGEIPVPTLYLTWSIIYFLAGISWMYILRASKGDVFKIHYLMMALVFIKSISLTFHAINMHYIAVNGTHEAIWAILYYITYVLRGLLLIVSIILVGTGWTFIKHILSENERRLFVIIIPLQILAITAYIFLEEKEEGDAVYVTWRQLFFLLDLICCGAILFPVVWSIRHLEAASRTDGKIVHNLKKLKIFKHFYIMVIFYIYFTRIIGFLLKQVLPFRYEWFDELSMEVVTFTFFALTAYKFQPASNNPYLQLSQEDTNLIQMELLSEENALNGSADTVLDLIEQDYLENIKNQTNNNTQLLPSGPDSSNPNLVSRKQQNNS